MNSKIVASLFSISMLVASSVAMADGNQLQHDNSRHADRGAHGAGWGHQQPMREASMDRPGGAIPHEDWHKGERVPAEYRDRNYEIDNWHEHGLSAPPRGYHWVGVNGDYVLAAVATGVIASVLASH